MDKGEKWGAQAMRGNYIRNDKIKRRSDRISLILKGYEY